jgi:hypothetical protein
VPATTDSDGLFSFCNRWASSDREQESGTGDISALVKSLSDLELIVALPPMAKGCPRKIRTIVDTCLFAPGYTLYAGMTAKTFVNSKV